MSRVEVGAASAQARADILDAQEQGEVSLGSMLRDSGAKARMFREVSKANLGAGIMVDLASDTFTFEVLESSIENAHRPPTGHPR